MGGDVTPALRWAAWLRALVEHLTRYPHLAAPSNLYGDTVLLVSDSGAALLAWADTFTSPAMRVSAHSGVAHVRITGKAAVDTLTVVCIVPGFLAALDTLDDRERSVDLDVLRRFVEGCAS